MGLDFLNYVVILLYEYWFYNICVVGRILVGYGIYIFVIVRIDESSKCCMDFFFLNFSYFYLFFRDY